MSRSSLLLFLPLPVLLLYGCGESKPPTASPAPAKPKILQFYAAQNPAPKGQDFSLCYGTEDAEEVSISPLQETLGPSLSRCITANISQPTTFVLTAKGPGGQVQQEVAVAVGKPLESKATRHLIQTLTYAGSPPFTPGASVQICYAADAGATLEFTPPTQVTPTKNRACFLQPVSRTTTYILTARNAANEVDRMQITIPVQ